MLDHDRSWRSTIAPGAWATSFKNMSIAFVDPRADVATEPTAYELRLDTSNQVTIGLLANGFPDSVAFLDHVEAALADLLPNAGFRRYDKGDASSIASDQMLSTIAAECSAVVAAYGH